MFSLLSSWLLPCRTEALSGYQPSTQYTEQLNNNYELCFDTSVSSELDKLPAGVFFITLQLRLTDDVAEDALKIGALYV